MSSVGRRLQRTIPIAAAIALSGMTGCASVLSSLADPSLEKQFPGASAEASAEAPAAKYETPIPHQYQAYKAPSLRTQQRQFDRMATLIEVVDGIRWDLARLSPFGPEHPTVISTGSTLFCGRGSALVTGTPWMGAATLQPMALGEAVGRSRCTTAFRDHFLRPGLH
ncbi:MAG TPA: hypothetical protein VM099_10875 [Gemmatimonadaceae bacterium]|nr:hypothetical protein [Gemmatimonadaceae bacterium]